MRGAAYEVRAGRDFWNTFTPLRHKYTREQRRVIRMVGVFDHESLPSL